MNMDKINKITSNYFYTEKPNLSEISTLPTRDYEALLTYSSASADALVINRGLREHTPLSIERAEVIRRIDSLFYTDSSTNDYPMTVYRGMNFDVLSKDSPLQDILSLKNPKDNVFIDKGFISTSSSKQVAENFKGKKGFLLEINIPPNSKYLDLHKLSKGQKKSNMNLQTEKEYLFPRNSKFKVLSFDEKTRVCKVEYMGEVLPKPSVKLDFSTL